VDCSLCKKKTDGISYSDLEPISEVVEKIREYKNNGFEIVIYSSRQVRTYNNNIGKIIANTVPVLIEWLGKHDIPYDEIFVGKPWCGYDGFYVDDKAIRPNEFVSMTYEQVRDLLAKEGGE